MLKVVPGLGQSGTSWDHQGKSKISQIFMACSYYGIESIQFAYIEDGQAVLSERIGRRDGCENLKTFTFDYPSEYITRVSGCYDTYYDGRRYLRSIRLHTNKRKYEVSCSGGDPGCDLESLLFDPEEYGTKVDEFSYEVAGEFYGFFGTRWEDGIETIGFYMKPRQVVNVSGPDHFHRANAIC